LVLISVGQIHAQQADQPSPAPQKPPQDPAEGELTVEEVAGRLVVSGGTVVVTGDRDQPPGDSSVATKLDTPLLETPRSISIIDRAMLDDLGAISLTHVHDYAVGVTLLDERGPAFARGFPVDFYDLRRDGLRTYSWSVRETVALDRVQYLRGPSSVLYGDGSPGALINMVLKKPLPVPRYEIGVSGGGLGFGRLTADLTGPLTESRRVRYRVVAATEWLENGFDNGERRMTLFPTFAVDVGTRGTLTVDTEWYDQKGRNYRHVVPATPEAQNGDFSVFPWDLSINSPDYGWTGGNVSPGVRLDLALSQKATLHTAVRYTKIDGDIDVQALAALAPDNRTAIRFQYHEVSTWHEYQSDTFAATSFRTGRLDHRLVTGVEGGLSTADSEIGVGGASPLDIFNPVYPPQPEPTPIQTRYDVSRLGLYALDQIRFGNRVIVSPAVRWSHLEVENRVPTLGEQRSSSDVGSPSLGLVVLPRSWLSVYANVARGFEPPTPGQYLEDGRAPEPAEHAFVEGGVKADLLNQRLSVTGAGYHIRRTNVPEADVRGFYRQIGEGKSHGLELELVGSLARGLGIRAGYAWTSTEITRDTSGFVGRELPNAPRHKTDLWIRYRLPHLQPRSLMIAAGLIQVTDRFTARDNLVIAPGYARADLSASYELTPRLVLGLIAQNITDRRYVTSGNGAVFFAGQPRRLTVQLTSAF
jgi:iron complex outermembrane receptor protein